MQLHEIREHLKYLLYVRFLSFFFQNYYHSFSTEIVLWRVHRVKQRQTYTHTLRNPIPTLFRIQYQKQQFNMFDRIHLNDNCERKNEQPKEEKKTPTTEYNHFTAFSAGYPMDSAREI